MLRGFVSYSHKDNALCAELVSHLSAFQKEGRAEFWSDHAIDAGDQWHPEIMDALEQAEIALLLLSPDFYASEFIHKTELPALKGRHEGGALHVLPIRLRTAYSPRIADYLWLQDTQQVPRDGRTVTSIGDRDAAWNEVMLEIDRTITNVLEQRAARIGNSSAVDIALADARAALAPAMEIVKQVDDQLGAVSRSEIETALKVAKSALGADALALRDQIAAACGYLRRCKFPPDENNRLHQALSLLRLQMLDVYELARESGFPSASEAGLPPPELVPQGKIAEARDLVKARLDDLEARMSDIEASRQPEDRTPQINIAFEQAIGKVQEQSDLARGLLDEPNIDVEGVGAAVDGAAREIGRFVRRIARQVSSTLKEAALAVTRAASSLVDAGHKIGRKTLATTQAVLNELDTLAREMAPLPAAATSAPSVEPEMEEILASIRKIINEEPAAKPVRAPLKTFEKLPPLSTVLKRASEKASSKPGRDAGTLVEWYVARDGQQYGPIAEAQLVELAKHLAISPDDLVWREGYADWKPAHDVFPSTWFGL